MFALSPDTDELIRIGSIAAIVGMMTAFTGPRWFCLQAWAVSMASMFTADGQGIGNWTFEVVPVLLLSNFVIGLVAVWLLTVYVFDLLPAIIRRLGD